MSSSDAIIDNTPDQYGQVHPHETPELIANKLILFEKEIKQLKAAEAKGIKEAQLNCPDLLTDKFKLMFLRADVFNADVSKTRESTARFRFCFSTFRPFSPSSVCSCSTFFLTKKACC